MDLYDEVMKRRREEAERKAEAARLEISPARRMLPGAEETLRQAREPKPEPPSNSTSDEKTQEAERMKLQPPGLQRAPSPGGGNYVNSLSQGPAALEAGKEKEPTKQKHDQESLFEAARRRTEEARAMQDQQRNRPLERLYPDLMQQR